MISFEDFCELTYGVECLLRFAQKGLSLSLSTLDSPRLARGNILYAHYIFPIGQNVPYLATLQIYIYIVRAGIDTCCWPDV